MSYLLHSKDEEIKKINAFVGLLFTFAVIHMCICMAEKSSNLMFQVLPMFIFQHLPKECFIHPLTLGLRRQNERRLFGFAHSLAEFCFHDSLLWFHHRHVELNDHALQVA